jgi:HSP20 family protein
MKVRASLARDFAKTKAHLTGRVRLPRRAVMTVQRWDPFMEIRRLEDRLGRMWGRTPFAMTGEVEEWSVPLDMREHDGQVVIEASVPGVNPDQLDVSIEDGVLTIKGETKSEREEQTENYLLKERRAGAFYRAVRLPESVDPEQAESHYEDGILKITLPKMPEKQPRRIKVDTGSRPQSLGTGERETMQESSGTAEEREM